MKPKKPAGNHYRKQRRTREAAEREAHAARVGTGQHELGLKRFARIGKPPKKTGPLLPWTANLVAEALYQAANDTLIDEATRRGQIATLADRMAKLHSRADVEAKVKHLEKKLDARREMSTLDERPASSIKKPPTARGFYRGPLAIPPAATTDDEPSSPKE